MKTLFTLLALLSFSSVFAAEPACKDEVVDKITVRKCVDAAACAADKPGARVNDKGVCVASTQALTKCPDVVEKGRATAAAAAAAAGTDAGTGQGK